MAWRFHAKSVFFCKILNGDLYIDALIRVLLDFASCKSDSWKRYTLKCLSWCVDGEMGNLVQWGGGRGQVKIGRSAVFMWKGGFHYEILCSIETLL